MRAARNPTSWTRPLQIAVIALAVGQILYTVSYPYWSAFAWNWWDNMINPGGPQAHWFGWPLPPPGYVAAAVAGHISLHDILLELLYMYGGALLTVATAVAAIVVAIKRWSWGFLVIGVLLALYGFVRMDSALSWFFPSDYPPPPWGPVPMPDVGFEGLFGVVALVIWGCVIVALVTRGPWGMRQVA
jgi:hypothetical protein